MAWLDLDDFSFLATRTTADKYSAADINSVDGNIEQIRDNLALIIGGNTQPAQSMAEISAELALVKLTVYPVGAWYIQIADNGAATFDSNKAPATLFGGTWTLRYNSDYCFLRTEGTTGQARSSGLSADQFQGHYHRIQYKNTKAYLSGTEELNDGVPDETNDTMVIQPISDGTNGTPRTGAFTEPRNRLMRIYERTA